MDLDLSATISMVSCQTQDYSTDLTLNNEQEYIQDNSRVKATRSNITATRTVFEKVQAIICDHVDISPGQIQLSSIIRNDLGLDSLDFIEIIMSVEEELGISIPDEAIDSLITIEDLYNLKEKDVIKIIENSKYKDAFNFWKRAKSVSVSDNKLDNVYYVHHKAKIRYINPLVNNVRISKINSSAQKLIDNNLSYDMSGYVYLKMKL